MARSIKRVDIIEKRHSAGEMPVDRNVVMSKVGLKRKHLRRRPAGRQRDRLDLDVAKAVIREAWMPSLFAPGQRIVKKHWIIRTAPALA